MSISTRAIAPKRRPKSEVRSPKFEIEQAVASLKNGGVVIFPTETVYGIGTSVFSIKGIQRIYKLKGRHGRKPLALLVSSLAAAGPLLESVPPEAKRLAKRFWPGPLTLVFNASPLGRMVTGGLATIGVRIPDHPVALSILKKLGIPLATTSVNRSGQKPAISGTACARLFGSDVDCLINAGICRVKIASSVVDLSHYPFTVIREGSIPRTQLEKALF